MVSPEMRLATNPALFILFSSEHTAHCPVGGHGTPGRANCAAGGGIGIAAAVSLDFPDDLPQARANETAAKNETLRPRTLGSGRLWLGSLVYQSADDNGDVVGSSAVERVLQELLANLFRRCHRCEALADLLV